MNLNSFDVLTPSKVSISGPSQIWSNVHIVYKILEHLSVPDLCSMARVCHKFKDIVYDESIWIQFLRNMGLEDRLEVKPAIVVTPAPKIQEPDSLLDLDSDISTTVQTEFTNDPESTALNCIERFRYSPGNARAAFMNLYRTLAPYYFDVARTKHDEEPTIFQIFKTLIDRAKILKELQILSKADINEQNHTQIVFNLNSVIELFENTAIHDFETAVDSNDIEKLKNQVSILSILNGSDTCSELFLQKQHITNIDTAFYTSESGMNFDILENYLNDISTKINSKTELIDQVFSPTVPVAIPLIEQIIDENLMDKITDTIEDVYEDSISKYLRTVPMIYTKLMDFRRSIKSRMNSGQNLQRTLDTILNDRYHNILQSYLSEELRIFTAYGESEVEKWRQTITNDEAELETVLWSGVSKQKDKNAFLSTFKKVVMMPVSAISRTDESRSGSTTPSNSTSAISNSRNKKLSTLTTLPTTELDAMVAVMNNKLESIKTLFSLELAVNLIRTGKEAIERISTFLTVSGENKELVRKNCESIFVELVRILGGSHVMGGFKRALDTLYSYDPKKYRKTIESEEIGTAVEPLAIFAELVNIGDLIQQMIHVFFEEELGQRKLVDRTDFLSPAVNSKKKFEQKLDDSVANGLSRGIDVLIDQIDFTLMTQQPASDFNPPPNLSKNIDVSPTNAATKVVSLLGSHMRLLVGATDKSVLDVFQQEVGLRFYASICKQLKRKVISTEGSIKLISDLNYYYNYIASLKQKELLGYFAALKEVGQLFLIDGSDARSLGQALSDLSRFRGVMKSEEILEFVQQRADWPIVKKEVEKVMFGFGLECVIM